MTTPATQFPADTAAESRDCIPFTELYNGPLVSVADLSETAFPSVTVPDNRYGPLCEHGARRAMNCAGTIENHERGILGEYAAAELFGVPDEVDTELYENGDPGYDLEEGDVTVDVKTVGPQTNNPLLMLNVEREVTADIYVVVQQQAQRHYRMIGYAPASVVADAPVRLLTGWEGEKVRVVEQDRLVPLTAGMVDAFR